MPYWEIPNRPPGFAATQPAIVIASRRPLTTSSRFLTRGNRYYPSNTGHKLRTATLMMLASLPDYNYPRFVSFMPLLGNAILLRSTVAPARGGRRVIGDGDAVNAVVGKAVVRDHSLVRRDPRRAEQPGPASVVGLAATAL